MGGRGEHDTPSLVCAQRPQRWRPSKGKPQDLQRKGRTTTASHGTLASLNGSKHELPLLYCEVSFLGVSNVVRSELQAGCGGCWSCDGLRNARELELSLCLCQARALRLGCEPRAIDFDVDFRHPPSHAPAALRFDSLEDNRKVIITTYTAFKMPLGRFAYLYFLLYFLKS